MRKVLLVMAVLCVLPLSAQAILIDNSDGTVTDSDKGNGSGLMWLQMPGPDNAWQDALSWADALVFAGHDDWRLPSALDFDTGLPDEVWWSVNNEFGHLYGVELGDPANVSEIAPLMDYFPVWFWTGTPDLDGNTNGAAAGTASAPAEAFMFFWSFDGLWLNQSTADRADATILSLMHVTAVRDLNGEPPDGIIPEPATILLLGSALMGLAAFRRKRRSR